MMSSERTRRARKATLAAAAIPLPVACAAVALIAACSGASSPPLASSDSSCSSGATSANERCFVNADGAPATTADGAAEGPTDQNGTDSGGPGTSAEGASATDGAGDATLPDAAVTSDSASGADVSMPAASDPCPDSTLPSLWADCSGECTGQSAFDASTCGTSGNYALVCPGGYESGGYTTVPGHDFTLRTPANAVAACEAQCAADGASSVTAAVVFDYPYASNFTIEVGTPWKITSLPEEVLPGGAFISCKAPGGPVTSGHCLNAQHGVFIVWTDDPAPPARNIVIHEEANCP